KGEFSKRRKGSTVSATTLFSFRPATRNPLPSLGKKSKTRSAIEARRSVNWPIGCVKPSAITLKDKAASLRCNQSMKGPCLCILMVSLVSKCLCEQKTPIPLWANGAPGALGAQDKDIPTITPYVSEPNQASGAAMVILPGGGYGGLAPHEGNDYA